jgi:hypothetical protein
MDEHVITETRLPPMGGGGAERKFSAYTVRHILTRLVAREEFEKPGDGKD